MKTLWMVLLAACVVGVGCGKKASEKISEKIIEKSMERDGIKSDVRISDGEMTITTTDKDGKQISIEGRGENVIVRNQDGTTAFTAGSSAKLPDTFPKDVYVHAGATVATTMSMPAGFNVTFSSKDKAETITAAYKSKMAANGWQEESAFTSAEQTMIAFKKENRNTSVMVIPEDGKAQIILSVVTEKQDE